MINTQDSSPLPQERRRPQQSNQLNQQRPVKETTSFPSYKATLSQIPGEQRWVPKLTKNPTTNEIATQEALPSQNIPKEGLPTSQSTIKERARKLQELLHGKSSFQ